MKEKYKIVMLPTDDNNAPLLATKAFKESPLRNPQYYPSELWNNNNLTKAHLYIISDGEIKEGNPFIYLPSNSGVSFFGPNQQKPNKDTCKKVIATTDPNITKVDEVSGDNVWISPIPQIPQSLVEYYVEYQSEYIELEYECQVKAINYGTEKKPQMVSGYDDWITVSELSSFGLLGVTRRDIIKLNNNEVVWVEPRVNVIGNGNIGKQNIPSPKDRYTHEDLIDFAFNTAQNCQGMNDLEIEQWIKNNL